MYLSPALKNRLRPFAPVLLPIYRTGVRSLEAVQAGQALRAQRREDAGYCEEMRALMQGLRRAPDRYAPQVVQAADLPEEIRRIAAIAAGQAEQAGTGALSGAELKAALRLLHWWSGEVEASAAMVRLSPAVQASSLSMLERFQWRISWNRAFNGALKAFDVLRAKALLDSAPEGMRRRLATALDARLPMLIARHFLPDQGDASLAWMEQFPRSAHQEMRRTLVQAVQSHSSEMLRDVHFEYLERVILNPANLTADLDGAYYRFLHLIEDLLPERVDASTAPETLRLQALVERKMMRRDVLRRNYTGALVRARALCRSPEARPEDLYARVDLLNKLGRTALVKRYVNWLHSVQARGAAPAPEIALRLWAAWSPKSALEVLGDRANWAASEKTAKVALRSLIRLRRYEDAAELARRVLRWPSLYGQAQLAEDAQRALRASGLSIPADEDAALHMLPHWLAEHERAPAPAYTPHRRRVLIYSHSLGIGGAERQVTNLISALCEDQEASSVHLLLKERPQNAYSMSQDDARFHAHDFASLPEDLPAPWRDHPLFEEILELCRPLGLSGISQILRAIYTLRPEVVHVRGGLHAEVVLAAVLAGVPRVVVHFGSMTRGQQSSGTEIEMLREKLVERAIGLCAAYPQVVLAANSRAAANDWARAAGLPESRMDVLYNAVDAEELGYSAPAPFDPEKRPLVVGGVFRFAPVKDPLLWVEVARLVHAAVPDVRFLMVGDGPMRKSVERAIEMAGLKEHFELPGLITKGLFAYLRRMDLSLMSTRTESLPNAVIEAQLAGLPVIAPDVGGIAEAIADETTARLPERTAPALAEAVIAGLQDTDWRADVHARAPDLVLEKFSRKRQLESTKAVYGWS